MIRLPSAVIWLGGLALLAATAIDTLAVIGRHVGLPLLGSIELVQAAVLVAGTVALVVATAADRHARVRLLVDRLGSSGRAVADSVADFLAALFLLGVFLGSAWLAIDVWSGHELSEIAGVPWRWLRMFVNLGLLVVVFLTLRSMFRGSRP